LTKYIPERGDIVWLSFTPQSGHEQHGKKPAIVLSPKSYNSRVSLALFCPITTKVKDYPFEVKVNGKKINGVVLADQIKSLDWKVRTAAFIEKADAVVLEEVLSKLSLLLFE
jgi:mRNA interferase MazF